MTSGAETSDVMAGGCDPGVVASWASEAVRAVNRLTLVTPEPSLLGWEGVADIYRVLGELHLLAERMPQALGQLARHLDRPRAGVRYRSGGSTIDSPETILAAASAALEAAQQGVHQVGRDLAAAQNSVGQVGIW